MMDDDDKSPPSGLRRLGLLLLVVAVATDIASLTIAELRAIVGDRVARRFDDLVPEERLILDVARALLDASER